MCPQCGTRHDDWDDGGDAEDAYAVTVQRCIGCQTIADKQEELQKDGNTNGLKVALIPASVHAALEAQRQLNGRRRRHDDEDDE